MNGRIMGRYEIFTYTQRELKLLNWKWLDHYKDKQWSEDILTMNDLKDWIKSYRDKDKNDWGVPSHRSPQ